MKQRHISVRLEFVKKLNSHLVYIILLYLYSKLQTIQSFNNFTNSLLPTCQSGQNISSTIHIISVYIYSLYLYTELVQFAKLFIKMHDMLCSLNTLFTEIKAFFIFFCSDPERKYNNISFCIYTCLSLLIHTEKIIFHFFFASISSCFRAQLHPDILHQLFCFFWLTICEGKCNISFLACTSISFTPYIFYMYIYVYIMETILYAIGIIIPEDLYP